MGHDFDQDEAKSFLFEREKQEKELLEQERLRICQHAISSLREEFKDQNVEVFLVGSILRPFSFTSQSDIDVVLKNFKGDRFEIWTKLEEKIGREVEIILFEKCLFQEFVNTEGLKVI